MTLRCRLFGHTTGWSVTRSDGSYTSWCHRCGTAIAPRKPRRGRREALCVTCNATGRVVLIEFAASVLDPVMALCPKCDGTGKVDA